ncbi:hypothetical protein D0T87_22065 [Bacteroides sp. 51]|nr:hypothetical protein [Bacteroides sp. 51]
MSWLQPTDLSFARKDVSFNGFKYYFKQVWILFVGLSVSVGLYVISTIHPLPPPGCVKNQNLGTSLRTVGEAIQFTRHISWIASPTVRNDVPDPEFLHSLAEAGGGC